MEMFIIQELYILTEEVQFIHKIMFMRIIKIIIALLIFVNSIEAQKRIICGLDFDYKSLLPKDTFSCDLGTPSYYVSCLFDNGRLEEVDVYLKESWMKKHLKTHIKIEYKNHKIYFIYDNGKTWANSGRYQRLLSRKAIFTDTAVLINDTLIFKNTNQKRYAVHLITNLFSDSVIVDNNKLFPKSNENSKLESLASFENYINWFQDSTFSYHYKNVIYLRSTDIINHIKIKDPSADYTFKGRFTKDDFDKKRMPISIFWIKHSGLIY